MRNRYVLLADAFAIVLAAWLAFAFRFGWLFYTFEHPEFRVFVGIALVVKIGTFMTFGLYRRFWRYANFNDLVAIVLANSTASVIFAGIMVAVLSAGIIGELSRSVPPLDWLFSMALTVGMRATIRAVAESQARRLPNDQQPLKRVLIVGGGDAGALAAREMRKNPQLGLQPVGFLDDDRTKTKKQIYGLPVLGVIAEMERVAAERRVDEVVIAIPTAGGRTVRAVVEQCQSIGLPSKVLPGIYELLDGQLSVNRLRKVDIADLLRRPQVHTTDAGVQYLRGECVLITGAGGSIGSELCRQVAHAGPAKLVLIGHGENSIFAIAAELRTRFPHVQIQATIADVRHRDRVLRVFRAVAPSIVFHAAAHKHVPLMEDNPSEAITNNVLGTRNIVDAAMACGVKQFVMVSTDKAAAPSNMMGASKRVAELIVQRAARQNNARFVVVRFGNVLGSRGSVVPTFRAQIEAGGPVTVTHPDVQRYFMTIPEAVHLILQAGGIGTGGELFVLDMGEPVLLRDLAADMIRLSGFDEVDVPIVYTGLRPGEKLNEILWEDGATIEPTAQAGVRRVWEKSISDDSRLDDLVATLGEAAGRDDNERLARIIREFIPTATVTIKRRDEGPREPATVVRLTGA